jgi:23S rRNA pseudouridine2605 synthase
MIRLNKYLSLCGVSSRRGAETLIAEGKVSINGHLITAVGTMVNDPTDVVKVNGRPVSPIEEKIYLVLNKPRNVMTTLFDPFRRRTIMHFLRKVTHPVYPVGRLDFDTEGVLLMTNDGDLAYRLAHPKYQVKKVYEAKVSGRFSQDACNKVGKGIRLKDGAIGHGHVDVIEFVGDMSVIRLTLTEGRKHEVKQLCQGAGYPVRSLRRIDFAGISARGIHSGHWRFLSTQEIDGLKAMVDLS